MADQTSPIQQIQSATNVATRLNENFDAASPAMLFGRNAATTAGLTWGYIGGRFGGALIASGTVALTASTVNYIVAALADGVVSVSATTTNWNDDATYLPLYLVTTGADAVTDSEDHRQALGGAGGPSSVAAADITDGTTVGRSVLTAASELAARTAIGAGTGNGSSNFSGAYADLSGKPTLGTAAALNVAASGDAAAGEVVKGDDTRLGGGSGMTNPMTTAGDLIVGGVAGAPARLGISTNGYVLTLASGVPVWAASGGGGGLTGFSSSLESGAPNVSVNASVLVASGGSSSQDAVFSKKGDGAILAQLPTATDVGGNKRGANAVDFQTTRTLSYQVASGTNSFLGGGGKNTASGIYSAVTGGFNGSAAGAFSFIGGGRDATTRGLYGVNAHCAGSFSDLGNGQVTQHVLTNETSAAVNTRVLFAYRTDSAANSIVLPDYYTYAFDAIVSAMRSGYQDSAAFRITGCVKRLYGAASVVLVGTPVVVSLGADAGASGWSVAAGVNTSIGSLEIIATSGATGSVRWCARVVTVEISYA